VEPRKFLDLAQLLVLGTPQPERLRSATSRAYYAVYNVSRKILSDLGFQIPTGPSGHGEVCHRFGNSGDTNLQMVGSQLGALRRFRNNADYDLADTSPEKPANVKAHVEQAKRMIETVERSCAGQTKQRIVEAIKEWERLTSGGRPDN
jgi:uncharacterized protein (UPF0332 family)